VNAGTTEPGTKEQENHMHEHVQYCAEVVNNFMRDNEIDDQEMFLVLLIEELTKQLRNRNQRTR
jgi:hypothetical protein